MDRKEFIGALGKGMIGGSLLLSGCSGLLDQNNPNTLTPKTFWKTADDAKAGVAAIYNALVFAGRQDTGFNNWAYFMVPAMYRADDIGIVRDVAAWFKLSQNDITASNDVVEQKWSIDYILIFRANQVLANVPNIKMDDSLKSRYLAEAKVLRAYAYFDLVNNYLNVPVILKPEKNGDYSVDQSPPDEIWKQIEKDLNDGADNLPTSYDESNKGRVTKGTALGYLGKAHLYQEKWGKAVSVFEQIINSGNYGLVPEFKNIFPASNEFNEETLFEISFSNQAQKGVVPHSPRNREESLPAPGGWYECYPSQWLFKQMSKEKTAGGELDPRLYHTILWNGSGMKYYGQTYSELIGNDSTNMGWMKYSGAELDHTITQYSSQNNRLLRYADILLMHAEAIIKSNGPLSDARTNINKVRRRANLAGLSDSMTKKQILQEIEHQRIVELADEGNRWYDLVRWGGSIDGKMTIKQNLVQHGAIGAQNFDPNKHKVLPIPLTEMQTNTKVKQNPGY
jgi:hypothetical protein